MTRQDRLTQESIRVGDCFRGRSLALTLPRILAFSAGAFGEPGWPQRNLHTDVDRANEAGLPAIIASGTQFEGLLISSLIGLFGPAWHDGGSLDVKIVKSVIAGEVVTPVVRVRAVEEGVSTIVGLEVSCETQDGAVVLVGTARVPLAVVSEVR